MTVIVAYKCERSRKTVLVADRVWFGYGPERVTGRKIRALSDHEWKADTMPQFEQTVKE